MEQKTAENVEEGRNHCGESQPAISDGAASNACFSDDPTARAKAGVKEALRLVHEDIRDTYYGCALVIPSLIQSTTIVCLGSGAGRDCFALSKLVGEEGHVIGIEMTEELLDVAKTFIPYHQKKFGYSTPNVEFRHGLMEDLSKADIGEGIADIVISNCVLSLSEDKQSVFREAHRVLKEGGELYFNDIYVEQELPPHFKDNEFLWGEGLSGALHWQKLLRMTERMGFSSPRLVDAQADEVHDEELSKLVGDIALAAATYRLFKVTTADDQPEPEPALVTYRGSIPQYEECLPFDMEHIFVANCPVRIEGKLAAILKSSRYLNHFSFEDCMHDASSEVARPCPTNPFDYIPEEAFWDYFDEREEELEEEGVEVVEEEGEQKDEQEQEQEAEEKEQEAEEREQEQEAEKKQKELKGGTENQGRERESGQ